MSKLRCCPVRDAPVALDGVITHVAAGRQYVVQRRSVGEGGDMPKFVQIGHAFINVERIVYIEDISDKQDYSHVLVFLDVPFFAGPEEEEPYQLNLYGDDAQRFAVWWRDQDFVAKIC